VQKILDENQKNEALEPTETPEANPAPPAPEETPPDFTKDPAVIAFIEKKVQEGIQKALQGRAPRANTTQTTEQELKDFSRMSYKERLKLYQSDPITYNRLSKGSN
jgi:hypothetical protein